MELLQTQRKEKLPKGFSYPIGAMALSESLAGVPQFEQFRVWFGWRDVFRASKYRENLKKAGKVEIIRVELWHSPMFGATWNIRVHAVPGNHAARVKELLADGDRFADVRRLLIGFKDVGDRFQWALKYDLGTETIDATSD